MEGTYFENLPQDIIDIIASYLSPIDLVNLGVDLNSVHYSKADLKTIDLSCDFRMDLELSKMIERRRGLDRVETLNLNGLYWIPAANIRNMLKKMPNLINLFILGTKMRLAAPDVEIYVLLEKLRFLAVSTFFDINRSHMVQFGKKFPNCDYLVQMARTFYVKHQGKTRIFSIVLGSYQMTCCSALHVYSIDWMNLLLKNVDANFNVRCIREEHERSVVSLAQFSMFVQNPVEVLSSVSNLAVVDDFQGSGFSSICLDALTLFVNLERLEVDVTLNVETNFLGKVFTNCTRLKSIKLRNQRPQLNIAHIKYAKNLKQLSYITNLDMNIDRFLEILVESDVRLVRIYLKTRLSTSTQYRFLDKFMELNPQLILLVIENKMTQVVKKSMQKSMDNFVKSPLDFYKAGEFLQTRETETVPLTHFDLNFMKIV